MIGTHCLSLQKPTLNVPQVILIKANDIHFSKKCFIKYIVIKKIDEYSSSNVYYLLLFFQGGELYNIDKSTDWIWDWSSRPDQAPPK